MSTWKLRLGIASALVSLPLVWLLGHTYLSRDRRRPAAPSGPTSSPGSAPPVMFVELAREVGLTFRHEDGPSPMHYFPEISGGGVAWLDFDQDGYLDLLFVQGGKFPVPPDAPPRPGTRLYRNQGDGTFLDVTQGVGLQHRDYGQ